MAANYTLANKLHLFAILVILIVLTLSWLFPRQSNVSESTMGKLDDLVTLMEKVNKNVDANMAEQRAINSALLSNYLQREKANNGAYDNLLEKYGIDVAPTPEEPNAKQTIKNDPVAIKNASDYDQLLNLHNCVNGVCE